MGELDWENLVGRRRKRREELMKGKLGKIAEIKCHLKGGVET